MGKRKNSPKHTWTDEENKYMHENYTNLEIPVTSIAEHLKLTTHQVEEQGRRLKLYRRPEYVGYEVFDWTIGDREQYFRENYPNQDVPMSEILKHLGIPENKKYLAVSKAHRIGIMRDKKFERLVTTKEVEIVRKKYPTMNTVCLGAEIGRTPEMVRKIAHEYCGVVKQKKPKKPRKRGLKQIPRWTQWEESFIKDVHNRLHIDRIGQIINKDPQAVRRKISRLGIYDTMLKKYRRGRYQFYFVTQEEMQTKLEYCRFWLEVFKSGILKRVGKAA